MRRIDCVRSPRGRVRRCVADRLRDGAERRGGRAPRPPRCSRRRSRSAGRRSSTGSTRTRRRRLCSEYAGKALPKDVAERIEKANLASIKWPADGKFVGDWKNGEKIAQEGRGMQYSDDPEGPGRRQLLRLPSARAAGALLRHDRPVAVPVRQAARLHRRDAQVRVRQDLQRGGVRRLLEHAALRPQRHPDRAADQGRRRAADGSRLAGQPVTRASPRGSPPRGRRGDRA